MATRERHVPSGYTTTLGGVSMAWSLSYSDHYGKWSLTGWIGGVERMACDMGHRKPSYKRCEDCAVRRLRAILRDEDPAEGDHRSVVVLSSRG